jgi:molybdate transport system substrate-binding protein
MPMEPRRVRHRIAERYIQRYISPQGVRIDGSPEKKMRRILAVVAATATLLMLSNTLPASETVTVFAAASLKEALDAQARQFESTTGDKVVVSYGASNALAKQIEAGAPAQVFISADVDWMDYLDSRKPLAQEPRQPPAQ